MKLQSLTIIFIIIILPVSLVLSTYIGFELKTIEKQNLYNSGLISATHDAIFSFEINSKNDEFSNNPEMKRDIIKSAVKTFENSLSTTCNLGLYGNSKIEEYIPAMVFGMYDGFYMYAPYETNEGYKHELRNYVYYSETIDNTDIVIRYSLDNYVAVSGTFYNENKHKYEYVTKAGYLNNNTPNGGSIMVTYKNMIFNKSEDEKAYQYFYDSYIFTSWFNTYIGSRISDLNITSTNDPEDENSLFVKHKRKIIKDKLQSILNSSINAYARKSGNNYYKMPVLTDEDWNKIYSNISVITFVQGMNLGFKNYNNYCVLNSTNSNEYVNPNLLYFTAKDENNNEEYHDIRCVKLNNSTDIEGYKIGDFEKVINKETGEYSYNHEQTACYECINGISNENKENIQISIFEYVRDNNTDTKIKKAYFAALARERYNTKKLSDKLNINY